LAKPKIWDDPFLEIVKERGSAHERDYVGHLTKSGLELVRIDGFDVTGDAVAETLAAMHRGLPIIVQAALSYDCWNGRVDILRRVEVPSAVGDWSYEPIDTKLARETKAGTILQLCPYSDLLTDAQGFAPEHMYVVAPWSEFKPQRYRFADYAAYYRKVKRGFLTAVAGPATDQSYPLPIEHCEICRWQQVCDKRRRDDDHLCLVAGISKLQINELGQRGIATVRGLAVCCLPTPGRPTPFHSAVTTAAQHSASTFVASGSWRAALALSQRHIEARRRNCILRHLAQVTPRQHSMLAAATRQDACVR
jgi:predicted RecB family nuclease